MTTHYTGEEASLSEEILERKKMLKKQSGNKKERKFCVSIMLGLREKFGEN